jgi:tartrate/fumarate subfamily iron-sulfur-dependent hydro-lyase beta chain
VRLRTPLTEADARKLRIGDRVELTGAIVTARDAAHKYLVEGGKVPFDLNVIYHCGPIVKGKKVVSAGPTTSIREEPYEAEVIRKFRVRAVIGKGGMGERTMKALRKHGCVYLAAVGGAGALMAERMKAVKGVHKLKEFGAPEAFWAFDVEDLPLTVTMDARGNSIYKNVEAESAKRLKKLIP